MTDIENVVLTTPEAAKYLRVKEQTLINWRHQGTGPTYVKPRNGLVRYYRDDLDAFLRGGDAK